MSRNEREGRFAGWLRGDARSHIANYWCKNRAKSRKAWALQWD